MVAYRRVFRHACAAIAFFASANALLADAEGLLFSPTNYLSSSSSSRDLAFRNQLSWTNSVSLWADALYMTRVANTSQSLFVDTATGAELVSARNVNFPYALGYRLGGMLHQIIGPFDVEAEFMNVDSFSLSKDYSYPADATFSMMGTPTNLPAGNTLSMNYKSRIASPEVNLRFGFGDILGVFAGARMVELHELLDVNATSGRLADFNVDNHLYGGQIGADLQIPLGQLCIGGVVKAGLFGNQADVTVFTDAATYGDKKIRTAFVGQADVMAAYKLGESFWIRGGYQVMWLEGVATAEGQMFSYNVATQKPIMDGSMFYHGFFAGLEFTF